MAAIVGIDAEILYVSTTTLAGVTAGEIIDVQIASGGTGYSVSDVLTVTGGGGSSGTLTVDSVSAGVIDGISVTTAGSGYSETKAAAVTGGGGSNATFDLLTSESINLPVWSDPNWTLAVNNSAYSWVQFTERNEVSINISVDVAEHKVFVTSLAEAWVEKARLYMDWSGSLSGYYDDADDSIFTTMKAGIDIWVLIFDSKRDTTKYWLGKCLLTSVDHSTPNEDFSTLETDFEGTGKLYRTQLPAFTT
jgi:hypothetical protein